MENEKLNLDEIKSTQIEVIKVEVQKEVKGGNLDFSVIIEDVIF